MQAKTWRSLALLLAALALTFVLAACGGGEEEPTPTPEPAPTEQQAAPTPTPEPPTPTPEPPTPAPATSEATEATPETGGETESMAPATAAYANPMDVLERFRTRGNLRMVSTFEDGTTREQSITVESAVVKADNQWGSNEFNRIVSVEPDAGDAPQEIVIYLVDDTAAIKTNDEWLSMTRDQAGMFTLMANLFTSAIDDIGADLSQAEEIGREEVNGIQTIRYRLTDPTLFSALAAMQGREEEMGKVESIQLDVWVAEEGNYIVKYQMAAKVSNAPDTDATGNEVRSDQEVTWSFEIYDINSPDVQVTLPEDAPKPGEVQVPGFEPGQFPLPEGAEVQGNMFGIVQIVTDQPVDEVIAFYEQALADLGWTMEGDSGFYQVSKDDQSFQMMINQDPQTGKTSISIIAGR